MAFELHLAPLSSAPATARHVMATWLDALGVADGEAEDVLIVLSELVTEAVSHQGGGDIIVRAFVREGHRLEFEVVSTPWPDGVIILSDEPSADPELPAHRMEVVAAISDDVAVQHDEAGHTVITVTLKVA